jgi:hypothetical protein
MPEPTAPAAAPAAPAPPPAEMHITPASVVERGPTPETPKKGSAKERMFSELRKKVRSEGPPPEPAKPESAPETKLAPEPKPEDRPAPEPESTLAPEGKAPADKKEKANPWKLLDEYKSRAANLEKELSEARKGIADPKEREAMSQQLKTSQDRLKELESEIRHVNYSKSQEFQDKYVKPYEQAWKRSMDNLKELTFMDPQSEEERPISPQDMLQLINMPLRQAREVAVKLFGDFANDVMSHRNEIRRLFEDQSNALEEARKNGELREEALKKQVQEWNSKATKEVDELWTKANQEISGNEKFVKFFKPVEGDDDGNSRLVKGYEMVDKAFSGKDPKDPRLTPEQRTELVRLHAAVRHRAAGFGRLAFFYEKAMSELASTKAELDKYRKSEPGAAGGTVKPSETKPASARDSVYGALRKLAR